MASENETVADIVREMRNMRQFLGAEMSARADRIEAAHRREVETARIAACSAQARFDEVLKERDAAIARKPRRNCDRFKNEDEADFHYRKEHSTAYAPAGKFIRWLFAPVAEVGES